MYAPRYLEQEGQHLSRTIEPGPEFGQLFHSFEHTAFRLETRDLYKSANEARALDQFTAGESVDMGWFQNWLSMIREATSAGRRFSRVRVVSMPPTVYSRFGIFCSEYTNEAGEDIRYLRRDDAAGLPDYDYWLFDSRNLVRMHFDGDENFLGGELIEDSAEIVQHNHWRDAAWHRAVRRDDFAIEANDQHHRRSPSS
ncbi:DUF6879 family protein [Allokutzneria multivorans]